MDIQRHRLCNEPGYYNLTTKCSSYFAGAFFYAMQRIWNEIIFLIFIKVKCSFDIGVKK
jgi:hypothetical protein